MSNFDRVPPCPSCEGEIDPTRVLELDQHEKRVVAGTDAEDWFSHFVVSCPSCGWLIMVTSSIGGWDTDVHRPVEAVERLTRRLDASPTDEALRAKVMKLLAGGQTRKVLGVPEIARRVVSVMGDMELLEDIVGVPWRRTWLDKPFKPQPRIGRKANGDPAPGFEKGNRVRVKGVLNGRLVCKSNTSNQRIAVPYSYLEPA